MRSVSVQLGGFAFEALGGRTERGSRFAPARMIQAVQCYLNDRGTERPGWPYPSFLREGEGEKKGETPGEEGETLELSVDEELWSEFEAEADRQGVSVRQLAEHSALYFAAELNAGRITERILDDFGEGGG